MKGDMTRGVDCEIEALGKNEKWIPFIYVLVYQKSYQKESIQRNSSIKVLESTNRRIFHSPEFSQVEIPLEVNLS